MKKIKRPSAGPFLAFSMLIGGLVALAAACAIDEVPEGTGAAGITAATAGFLGMLGSRGRVLASLAGFGLVILVLSGVLPIPMIERSPGASRPPPPDPVEVDDVAGDKHPRAVDGFVSTTMFHGKPVEMDRSGAVLGLDLAEGEAREAAASTVLYPTLGAAAAAAREAGMTVLPSIDMVDAVGKRFDDAEVAALERALHTGDAVVPGGKQGFLVALLAEVLAGPGGAGQEEAAQQVATALVLGGADPRGLPARVVVAAQRAAGDFRQLPEARPIGFYAGSPDLEQIFVRDRYLQRPMHPAEAALLAQLAGALDRRPALAASYARLRRIQQVVTSADANAGLELVLAHRDRLGDPLGLAAALAADPVWGTMAQRGNVLQRGIALLPFATSPEVQLFARLYPTGDPPPGDTMAALVAALRAGTLSLVPDADSGWYDRQLYALETLVVPDRAQEKDKLALSARYKKRLRQAFEAMMTKRRETHVKSVMMGVTGSAAHFEPLAPELAVEPAATCYLRTARGYRFLESALDVALGPDALERIRSGTGDRSLRAALRAMARRFYGLYVVVCEDIGMEPELAAGEVPPATGARVAAGDVEPGIAALPGLAPSERAARRTLWAETRAWLANAAEDPALAQDQRVIVPVLKQSDGRLRCWAVLGARLTKIRATWKRPPVTRDPVIWKPAELAIPVNVFRELTVGAIPLTRAELRAACDRGQTLEGAVAELEGSRGHGGTVAVLVLVALAALRARRRR